MQIVDLIARVAPGTLFLLIFSLHKADRLLDSTVLSVLGFSLVTTVLGLVGFYIYQTQPLETRVNTLEEDKHFVLRDIDDLAWEVERLALIGEEDSYQSRTSSYTPEHQLGGDVEASTAANCPNFRKSPG